MPTYVYACKSCGEQFEVIQKMSDSPLKECRTCPGEIRRVIFPPAVVYKGTGFYVTDYKNAGQKSESSSSSTGASSSSSSDSSTATKTETKTESSAPAKTEAKSST